MLPAVCQLLQYGEVVDVHLVRDKKTGEWEGVVTGLHVFFACDGERFRWCMAVVAGGCICQRTALPRLNCNQCVSLAGSDLRLPCMPPPAGKSRGFAFLAYEDQRSTVLSVDNLSGARVAGRVIRVEHVDNYKRKRAEVRRAVSCAQPIHTLPVALCAAGWHAAAALHARHQLLRLQLGRACCHEPSPAHPLSACPRTLRWKASLCLRAMMKRQRQQQNRRRPSSGGCSRRQPR